MSNSGLISRLARVLDEYEAGRLSSEQVRKEFEFHMDGLEKVGLAVIHASRDLTHRLVGAHCWDGAQEFIDRDRVRTVIGELRRFVNGLPRDAEVCQ